jgi:hypothetical protein
VVVAGELEGLGASDALREMAAVLERAEAVAGPVRA